MIPPGGTMLSVQGSFSKNAKERLALLAADAGSMAPKHEAELYTMQECELESTADLQIPTRHHNFYKQLKAAGTPLHFLFISQPPSVASILCIFVPFHVHSQTQRPSQTD